MYLAYTISSQSQSDVVVVYSFTIILVFKDEETPYAASS